MKQKRFLALLLAAVMLTGLLAGCGGTSGGSGSGSGSNSGGQDAAKPSSSSVELNVVTSYGGDDGHRKDYENAVKGYEEATGNKVLDASATSNEEWKAKVLTDFETGTEPDVLFFFTNADAEPIVKAGKVVDIATIRAEYPDYGSNMRDSMLAVASDGKNYAVPSSGFWENMFVNTKVLSDCGVAIPGPDYTWDQFLTDCQAIKDKGYTPIACSLFEVPHYWFEFCVMNNGTLANQLDLPASADDAAGQKWVAALNDIKDLYEKGFFPANTLTATDAETVQLFGDGEAAFLIDGSWKVTHFVDNYPEHLDEFAISYVPAKGERKASEAIGGISMGYFITKKAWDDPAKREAAVQFVEHMTSDEVMSTFVTTEVTALKNGASPSGLNALQQSAADANANITGVVGAVQDTVSSECKTDLFGNVQNVVTGAMTAEDAVSSAIALN
ncbi:ABC transporter substrate-binding protein [Oscillibacter sp.]|uniref:ABC transporter substrate-binding protein n=1 Tax=Oscillibacter sp. TaxID=1945593 RepID=UPI002D7E7489|nr:extracellular solute-binding protein [Oscillibacter sp.]